MARLAPIDSSRIAKNSVPPRPQGLGLELETSGVGLLALVMAKAPPGAWPLDILAPTDRPIQEYLLLIAFRTATFTQSGAATALRHGDMILVDPREPSWLSSEDRTAWLVLSLDRSAVSDRLAGAEHLPSIPIPRRGVMASLCRSCMMRIWRTREGLDGANDYGLTDIALDLVMRAVLEATDACREPEMRHVRTRIEIAEHVQAGLSDPAFNLSHLAVRTGLGEDAVRAAIDPLTPQDLIRRLRLATARRMLRSGIGSGMSIADIARSVGFRNASHFSDSYSRAYHTAPVSERRIVILPS